MRVEHNMLYQIDWDGKCYSTVEDEVVEVLTKEQHKSRLSTYTDYIDNFVRVNLVRRKGGRKQKEGRWKGGGRQFSIVVYSFVLISISKKFRSEPVIQRDGYNLYLKKRIPKIEKFSTKIAKLSPGQIYLFLAHLGHLAFSGQNHMLGITWPKCNNSIIF